MFELKKEQKEFYQADGYGCVSGIEVWIKVRCDREIPDFDAIAEVKYFAEGVEGGKLEPLMKMLSEHMGMFINEAMRLEKWDLGGNASLEALGALEAVKKALADYLLKSAQEERLRRVSEKIVCSCRRVTDYDIKEAIKKGRNTFELIREFTGAGTGCGSCENRVCDFLHLGKD